MAIDVQSFIEKTRPVNLWSLMSREVVESLVGGFCYGLRMRVSVRYIGERVEGREVERKDLGFYDPLGRGEREDEYYHPVCYEKRNKMGREESCRECTDEIALNYYNGQWKEPAVYRCHLNLWDMAYPIRVRGILLGVIFGGEVLLKADATRKELGQIGEYLVWDRNDLDARMPDGFDQVNDVCEAIDGKKEFTGEEAEQLKQLARGQGHDKNVDVGELMRRFKGFVDFGRVMGDLVGQLHDSEVNAAEQGLLTEMARELVSKTSDPGAWWEILARVIDVFGQASDIGRFDVYCREQSRYVQKIGGRAIVSKGGGRQVPFSVCIELPVNELRSIAKLRDAYKIKECFRVPEAGYIYKCDVAGPDGESISTIVIIHGLSGRGAGRKFAEDFCSMMGLRADVCEVLSRIIEDRRDFENRVRRVCHSAKTPLQVGLSDVRRVERLIERLQAEGKDPILQRLSGVRKRILESKCELLELAEKVKRARRDVDMGELLESLAEEMEPLASEKGCHIIVNTRQEGLVARISQEKIRMALRNLLDNAIKYSFNNQRIGIAASAVVLGNTLEIVFRNYGIGIPKDKLETILREGERGKVVDIERPSKDRSGTGLGLPIAMDIMHEHGGTLNIDSFPTVATKEGEYLRYVTKVTVTLPLVLENRK